MHVFNEKDKSIDMIVPASGVVTALEPILLGVQWKRGLPTAQATRDREVVDEARSACAFPPDHPSYTRCAACGSATKKTKAITKVFSNEGLWPLSHNAHARPIFSSGGLAAVSKKSIGRFGGRSPAGKWGEPNRRYFSRKDYHFVAAATDG